jgi:hypothetical protein
MPRPATSALFIAVLATGGATVAAFTGDGSQPFATVMATDYSFTKTNWTITFDAPCGGQSRGLK